MFKMPDGRIIKTIEDVSVGGKTVLVRTDYNIPKEEFENTDGSMRIKASLQTIEYLLDKGAKAVVLMSHLGRPEGRVDKGLSLGPIAEILQGLLPDRAVRFVDDVSGPDVETAVKELPRGGVLLLENLRFYPGEEDNSVDFVQEIVDSTGADLFVQDGFSVAHRAHASTDAITKIIPSVAGLLLKDEVVGLSRVVEDKEDALLAIIGGAKIEDKRPMIDLFSGKDPEVGAHSVAAQRIAVVGKIAADGYENPDPRVYVAKGFATDGAGARLDIDEDSLLEIVEMIKNARTIIWSGTAGKVEESEFAKASRGIAYAIAQSDAVSVIGGGDTATFVTRLMEEDPGLHYTLVSTGGSAMLVFLAGKPMPGIDALVGSVEME